MNQRSTSIGQHLNTPRAAGIAGIVFCVLSIISQVLIRSSIPAYGLLNFSLDWTSVFGKPFDASFFMTNATDKLYWNFIPQFYNSAGFESRFLGPPRMFGVRLRKRFGS